MSVLSNAVFTTINALQAHPNSPTRSQVFELYAACLGFKTYAAFKTAGAHQALSSLQSTEIATIQDRLHRKITELAISATLLNPLLQSILQELQKLHSSTPQMVLMDAAKHLGLLDGKTDLPPQQIDGLKQQLRLMALAGDGDARLLYVLWQSPQQHDSEFEDELDDESEDDEASEYWYRQRLAGAQLSEDAMEWADAYERSLVIKQKTQQLANEYELNSLAAPNVEQVLNGSERPNFSCSLPASMVVDWLDQIYPPSPDFITLLPWFYLSHIQHPTYGGLHGLFGEIQNPTEQYALYLFALDSGIDISRGHYWLVNSYTGEEWDEYGPAEPQGYDGVTLPTLTTEEMQSAIGMKQQLTLLSRSS
ncbi:MAG: hypothetical protein E6Q75_06040 [Rheinheimera sp.]|nr:MAG: hypothetical protein E6Q75_06040 [Rheinheimera sp.]